MRDPWDDALADIPGTVCEGGEERISSYTLLNSHLKISTDRLTDVHSKRLGYVMRRLGWEGPKPIWLEGRTQRGYARPAEAGKQTSVPPLLETGQTPARRRLTRPLRAPYTRGVGQPIEITSLLPPLRVLYLLPMGL